MITKALENALVENSSAVTLHTLKVETRERTRVTEGQWIHLASLSDAEKA